MDCVKLASFRRGLQSEIDEIKVRINQAKVSGDRGRERALICKLVSKEQRLALTYSTADPFIGDAIRVAK
nr:MAG TPA: hypothetical protein [Caudoviricetes sp.]